MLLNSILREYSKDGTNKRTNISNFSEDEDKDKQGEFHAYMDDNEEEENKSNSLSASREED